MDDSRESEATSSIEGTMSTKSNYNCGRRKVLSEKDDAIIYKLLKIEFAIMWYRGKQMIYQYNHKEISEMQRRSAEGCK